MRQIVRAEIQNLDRSEILSMVDQGVLDKIKLVTPNPELRVFAIGHEGQASPNIIGMGTKVLNCLRGAVQALANRLQIGTPVFNGHATGTNSHDDRVRIGEVVGKALKEISGKLYSLAVVHLNPSYGNQTYDVASVEADVQFSQSDGEAWIEDIESVTGVALGHSAIDRPGFPGATLLGCLQAFAEKEGSGRMKREEVIQAVKDLKLTPSDVFGIDDIMKDGPVVEKVKADKHDLYQQNKRIESELAAERDNHAKAKNEFDTQIKALKVEGTRVKAAGVLDSLAAERKMDAKQIAFAKKSLDRFNTDALDEPGLKVDLNKFIDTSLDDYRKTAEIFGVKLDAGAGSGAGNGTDNAAGSGTGGDLSDPKVNDFIPKI